MLGLSQIWVRTAIPRLRVARARRSSREGVPPSESSSAVSQRPAARSQQPRKHPGRPNKGCSRAELVARNAHIDLRSGFDQRRPLHRRLTSSRGHKMHTLCRVARHRAGLTYEPRQLRSLSTVFDARCSIRYLLKALLCETGGLSRRLPTTSTGFVRFMPRRWLTVADGRNPTSSATNRRC